jgi:hypothetical protein
MKTFRGDEIDVIELMKCCDYYETFYRCMIQEGFHDDQVDEAFSKFSDYLGVNV